MLFKSDLKRMLKDKLFLILIILSVVFAFTTPLLNKGLEALMNMGLPDDEEPMRMFGKEMLFSVYSPVSDIGLIIPIFVAIILNKDFSYGTIRNKIIVGRSRLQVYLSLFASAIVITCIAIAAYGITTFAACSILFKYSSETTIAKDFGMIVLSYIFIILCYACIASMISFFTVGCNKIALSIVFHLLVGIVLYVGSLLVPALRDHLIYTYGSSFGTNLLDLVNHLNPVYIMCSVTGSNMSAADVWAGFITPVFWAALITVFGILIFRKKNLK